MNVQDPLLDVIHNQIFSTLLGTIFFFIGLIACLIAAVRHRREFWLLLWFGLFIGFFGVRMLAQVAEALNLFPRSQWPERVVVAVIYLLDVPAFLFWAERTRSHLRRAFHLLAMIGLGIGGAGLGLYAISGSRTLTRASLALAIGSMLALGPLPLFPRFFEQYFVVQTAVLRVVMPAIAVLLLVTDIMYFFGHPPAPLVEPIGFAIWVFAIGYEAAQYTFSNEKRLLSIESELQTARAIQSSLLPKSIPSVKGLHIAVSYNPMSAVAGDFYQFLRADDSGIGILVADVTGHGVPAALIASMIKVAVQSVIPVASDPGRVLRELNRILTPELNGRLTSAAYLWIDTNERRARYSAAGHPELLQWSKERSALQRLECNGILFGVLADAEYSARDLALKTGDRFLLYTDGLVEPEDSRGEAFGDHRLEELIRENQSRPAHELIERSLNALKKWHSSVGFQEDDITLVVVDIL